MKLFDSGEDWWQNAVIMKFTDQWYTYAHGYKIAADRLVDTIDSDRFEVDFLAYPIAFLYRQSIELYLKTIIKRSRDLLGMEVSFPKHHDIYRLWIDSKTLIVKIWPDGPNKELESIQDYIRQFSEYDPTSEVFRYPENTKGKPIEISAKHINLRNLCNIMNDLIGLLEGAADSISQYIDDRGEMRDYFSS